MKCTDMFHLRQAIAAVSRCELRKAVELCGGSYSWSDDIEKPIVLANTDWSGPIDVVILRVFFDESGCLAFEAAVNETGEEILGIDFSDIEETHLQYIIEYMKIEGDVSVKNMDDCLNQAIENIQNLIRNEQEI